MARQCSLGKFSHFYLVSSPLISLVFHDIKFYRQREERDSLIEIHIMSCYASPLSLLGFTRAVDRVKRDIEARNLLEGT